MASKNKGMWKISNQSYFSDNIYNSVTLSPYQSYLRYIIIVIYIKNILAVTLNLTPTICLDSARLARGRLHGLRRLAALRRQRLRRRSQRQQLSRPRGGGRPRPLRVCLLHIQLDDDDDDDERPQKADD